MSRGQRQAQTTASAATQTPPQAAIPVVVKAPPVEPPFTVLADRVELRRPVISLKNYRFIGPTQTNKLTPKSAYIAHGIVVIDELNIWFPLDEVSVGRW